eukprot:TRINITY_DN11167_c0_g1_i1.p1 TRINITY_DN11167_c0_g1~~TRINITY_DN11167_c0_g1_i1.p1  ORF type:complete len:411 (+),score=104.45 TRINITY_DN11167_c0_g1_i1:13-1245(+)
MSLAVSPLCLLHMSNQGREVFIVGAVRTPVGKGRSSGALHSIHPVQLFAMTLDELMKRTGAPKSQVEDVIGGVVSPVAEQGANVPRLAALMAGFPNTTSGVQLNRMCGSSQQAVHFAAQAIASGDMDLVIAGGVEMMGTVKMGSDSDLMKPKTTFPTDLLPFEVLNQGQSAELIAEKYGITRDDLDQLAGRSHELADKATKAGHFKREIFPIKVTNKDGSSFVLDKDEGIRVPVNYTAMRKLPTPFKKDGKISAANASQLSDGASAVLLASAEKAKELGLKLRARIVTRVVIGSDPVLMLDGPIAATRKALQRSGLSVNDIDVFEINEAFGSVVLAWKKELQPDFSRVNPNGGAMATGHPLGATGGILMTKLLHELERRNVRYGLQSMCIGFGMATATIIENMSFNRSKL